MGLIEKLVGEDFTLVSDGNRFYKTLEHSSFVVDTLTNRFYWNSKHIYGDCLTYLIKVRNMSFRDAKQFLLSVDPNLLTEPVTQDIEEKVEIKQDSSLVDLFYAAGRRYRDYWYTKRGYTDDTIDKFKLGYSGEWYTIPIYEEGKFVNFQVRKEEPKRIKHWYRGVGPHSFNFGVLKFSDWVIIAEGPPDAIILRQYNLPGISQTGGSSYWNKDWNPLFMSKKRIYIVYDNDDAGKVNAKKLGQVFGKRALIYTFDTFKNKYDITDYFLSGHTKDNFMELLEKEGKYEYEV